MGFPRLAGLTACVLALTGCAFGEADGPEEITRDQLAIMVLPQTELGADSDGFEVDDESGPGSARQLAEHTIDPQDTAASWKRAGWTAGYDLTYSTTKRLVAEGRRGAVSAGTSADLFATETGARAFIVEQIRQFNRFEGKTREGVKLVRADEFDASVGDEAWGVELVLRSGRVTMTSTAVAFRHGRLAGTAFYLRADGVDVRAQAASLALKLENRIGRVLAGELQAQPIPLPAKKAVVTQAKLARMTLALEDLPAGTRVDDEGRAPSRGGAVSYYRTFDVEDTMVGSSHLLFVRAQTRVFETEAAAASMLRVVGTPKGRRHFARAVLRGFGDLAGARARNVRVQALEDGRGATGIVVTFDMPDGRFRTATVFVRSGRSVATISGFCTAHAVHPGDLPPLGDKAHARLAALPV